MAALPGLETERSDDATAHRFWTKDAVLLDSMHICFFCNELPTAGPARSVADSAVSPHAYESAVERTG